MGSILNVCAYIYRARPKNGGRKQRKERRHTHTKQKNQFHKSTLLAAIDAKKSDSRLPMLAQQRKHKILFTATKLHNNTLDPQHARIHRKRCPFTTVLREALTKNEIQKKENRTKMKMKEKQIISKVAPSVRLFAYWISNIIFVNRCVYARTRAHDESIREPHKTLK